MRKKKQPPPNLRRVGAWCCGNCKHWLWGYEGEGECGRYSVPIEDERATNSCDGFEE
jgi:hypothetical protein